MHSAKRNPRDRLSERILVKIMIKHKNVLINDRMTKEKMQDDINKILDDFIQKTGRDVSAIEVKKQDGKYQLLLEVS